MPVKSLSLISAGYPPDLDGIGDYTFFLAQALAARTDVAKPVTVYTRKGEHEQAAGVRVSPFFEFARPSSIRELLPLVAQDKPDWLVLQYNPFCWGSRGWCPTVPATLRRLKVMPRAPKLAVMFHELFTEDAGWKNKLMGAWQTMFTLQVAQAADLLITSCQAYADWLGTRGLQARALPVGSNLPDAVANYPEEKGLKLTFGTFGSSHASRRMDVVAASVAAVRAQGFDARFVFVGSGGQRAEGHFRRSHIPFRSTGPVGAQEAAEEIAKLDVFLAPFSDGLSGRRASAIAALKAGVPLVSSFGRRTDPFLQRADGEAFFLAKNDEEFIFHTGNLAGDSALRRRVGLAGRQFCRQNMDWPIIATQLVQCLNNHDKD
jgi:glycosyltransferase involved in cell wall biosynthesis